MQGAVVAERRYGFSTGLTHQVHEVHRSERRVGQIGEELELSTSPAITLGQPNPDDRLCDLRRHGLEEAEIVIVEGLIETDAQDTDAYVLTEERDRDEAVRGARHVPQPCELFDGVSRRHTDDRAPRTSCHGAWDVSRQ